jgi:hypothetical protein
MSRFAHQALQDRRSAVLWLAMLASVAVSAAGSYEHVVIVPEWTRAPPDSIAMFHGPYAIDTGRWWRVVHAPAFLLALAALVLWREDGRRRFVAAAVLVYAVLLVATAAWILPELELLTMDPLASIPPARWKARASRWEAVSLARLALMYVNSALLVWAARAPSLKPSVRSALNRRETRRRT